MSAIDGLTCAEIARRLRVPEGTVMSRIFRGRRRLKKDLSLRRRSAASAA